MRIKHRSADFRGMDHGSVFLDTTSAGKPLLHKLGTATRLPHFYQSSDIAGPSIDFSRREKINKSNAIAFLQSLELVCKAHFPLSKLSEVHQSFQVQNMIQQNPSIVAALGTAQDGKV